jgi:hypothetical protein
MPLTRNLSITLTSWQQATGSLVSPGTFTQICAVNIPAGTYTVNWTVTLSGTVGAGDANNFALAIGSTVLAISVNAGAAGTYVQAPVTFTSPGGSGFPSSLQIKTWSSAPTAGATYGATIGAGGGTGQAQLGPASPGESWAPTRVSVSCSADVTTGTCEASIYAGPTTDQGYFVDGTFSGDTGDQSDGITGQVLHPGEFVTVVWTGGVPGATATMQIQGSRTVP